ncbi:hypothetical protein L3Y34_010402 [Caenorhabditis briggsae]|uniref:C2H2-type domain-containing protein n=1 Tax=Caenorhabditis briggsae TaxID=6238 RepID=A0AAE9CT17_CAEBR|nr:hypothetical protein L3Y34_010402 [Caenorhabditis briggsae]
MQSSSNNFADREECERKMNEDVARNVREIFEKTQLRPADGPRAGRPKKRQQENTKKDCGVSSAPSDASSSQEATRLTVPFQSQNAVHDDMYDVAADFPSFMELDFGEEFKNFDYATIFGDMEHFEEQEMIPSTSSGPPAQETKKRRHWKPKEAPCPHCGKVLSSATNVKRHENSCKVFKDRTTFPQPSEQPAPGNKKRRVQTWKPKNATCLNCEKVFYSKHTLKPHLEKCKAKETDTLQMIDQNISDNVPVSSNQLFSSSRHEPRRNNQVVLEPIFYNWSPRMSQSLEEEIKNEPEALTPQSNAVSDGRNKSETVTRCGNQIFSRPPVEMPVRVFQSPLNSGSGPKNAQEEAVSQLEAPVRNQCDGCFKPFPSHLRLRRHKDSCSVILRKKMLGAYERPEDIYQQMQLISNRPGQDFSTSSSREPSSSISPSLSHET